MQNRFFNLQTILSGLYRSFLVFLSVLILVSTNTNSVTAQEVAIQCSVNFPVITNENRPVVATLRCPFAGNFKDIVYVYDQAGDMKQTDDWKTALDFDDDIWVFDASGDGTANLIIDFSKNSSGLIADIYDDQNLDRQVDYEIENNQVVILEGKYPAIRFVTEGDKWSDGDIINYNLHILVDGLERANFSLPNDTNRVLQRDGKVDFELWIYDLDYDGRPDQEVRQVLLPLPYTNGTKTDLIVNVNGEEVPPSKDYIFWPYLGKLSDFIKPYSGGNPPIQVDWTASRIRSLSEFVASRGQEANWFIYSLASFGNPNEDYANLENPFGFYDIASDKDGFPELIIRSEYFGPHDEAFLEGFYYQPIEAIRYSWDQDNNNYLDYKMDLLGRYAITETVQLAGLAVRTVPYTKYPNWVITKKWDSGHFVAAENINYSSSEGIYEGFSRDWRDYYVTGLTDNQFLDRLRNTNLGIRHEYTPDLLQRPWLYFSPLDHKLHLQGAIGGYWNIDPQRSLHYADLDKDGYLDQWLLTQTTRSEDSVTGAVTLSETPHALLQVYAGKVFSASAGQVRIVESHVDPSSFRTLPPTNHAEWLALGDKLASHASPIASDDLAALAAQYSGPLTEIHGAYLEGFHTTDLGYAFTLNLSPGYQVLTDELGLLDSNLPAGNYRVEYNGSYQFTPLAHEQPTLSASPLSVSPESPQQPGWATLQVTLENTGAGALENLPIQVYANQPGLEKPLLLTTPRLDLPAGETTTLNLPWWPLQSGTWEIWLEIETDLLRERNIQVDPLPRRQVEVQPAAAISMFQPLSASAGGRLTGPVIGLLLSASLAAFAIVALILSKLSKAP